MEFMGSIVEEGPPSYSAVVLSGESFTSSSYDSGVLTVLNDSRTIAKLHITPFDNEGFTVANGSEGVVITSPGPVGSGESSTSLPASHTGGPVVHLGG